MLVGAVDFAGDIRKVVAYHQTRSFSKNESIQPFAQSAEGSLPGEGAVALVLIRLDGALAD
jgi:acyl transferase domain-containing protein